jgi:hypothetical protein
MGRGGAKIESVKRVEILIPASQPAISPTKISQIKPMAASYGWQDLGQGSSMLGFRAC